MEPRLEVLADECWTFRIEALVVHKSRIVCLRWVMNWLTSPWRLFGMKNIPMPVHHPGCWCADVFFVAATQSQQDCRKWVHLSRVFLVAHNGGL